MRLVTKSQLRGNPNVIRLAAGLLDRGGDQCRDFAAVKSRPALWPQIREPRRYAPWESFPLGVVMAALDAAEFQGLTLEEAVSHATSQTRSPLHPAAVAWVRHACISYTEACAWLEHDLAAEGIELRPERNPRVVQASSPVEHRILTAWGRWYASADGTVREFRRMRISHRGDAEAPSTLAVAFVAATGKRVVGDVYRDVPVETRPDDAPAERVRVVEVLPAPDVPPRVLVDASPEQIRQAYREHARPVAAELVAGGSQVPGRDCGECKLHATCEILPRASGLLGVDGRGTHRRTWSVTTGRSYKLCPAQAHLRDLHLMGRRDGDNPAIRRGVAVHEWLRVAHGRPSAHACTLADLPEPGSGDIGLARGLMTPQEYRDVRPYLLGHLDVCPLQDPATDVRPEPVVAAYDPAADVVVIAVPDLIRRVDGRLVYREQKSTSRPVEFTGDDAEALRQVPQLALAVCMIASGVFTDAAAAGTACAGGMVELEVMTPLGAEVMTFDAADPTVLAVARDVVTDYAGDWHRDTEFRATPGDWCAVCPATQWCPDKADTDGPTLVVDGMVIDARTGEVLKPVDKAMDKAGGRAAALAATLGDPDPDRGGVPPF